MGECSSCTEDNSGIADAIHHYWEGNEDFTTFLVLDDLNQPYDCVEWGNFGEDNIPLIVSGDEFPITNDWFGFDNYPWNVLINPDMEIVSMQNTNPSIWSMAEAVGDALGGCVDELASNFGEDANCLYEDNNFTSFEIDVLPVLDYWGCTGCHNEALGGLAGGLKMHNYESIMAGSNSGEIIGPFSENSILIDVLNQVNNATPFSDMWGTSFNPNSTLNKNLIYRISDWITEGALEFTNYGCTNIDACNYDSSATTNDGSCVVEDCFGECGGSAVVDECFICDGDSDGDGVSDYADACGVCNGDDSTCTGCMDDIACNYDASAILDGGCEYAEGYYNCDGTCLVDTDADNVCDEFEVSGCTDENSCNYNPDATDDDDSCDGGVTNECDYCYDGAIVDNDAEDNGTCDDDTVVVGCMDDIACNYDVSATHDSACEYAEMYYDCAGDCNKDTDGDGVCDELEITGCTDMTSCNYDSAATDDDGLCDGGPDDANFDCDGNCAVAVDCFGICGGDSELDDCDPPICSGGTTGLVANASCPLSIENSIPVNFAINSIYPNPFNPVVNIEYSLATSDLVNISIYDLNGQMVDQLFSEHQTVGNYHMTWDASEMSSGIYLITIQSGNILLSDQLILLK